MVDTEQKTAQILQTCLEAIQSGKETIDSVVSRYPELEDELRPQLENAVWLTSRRFVLDPSPEFVHRSRQRLVARIKAEQREAAVAPSLKSSLLSLLRMPPVVLRGVVTILVVFLLLMGADQMVENTSGSIPGDPGYSVKRTVEDLTLAVSSDPGQQIVLYLEYSQRRLGEVNVLVDKSRYVDATTTLNEFEEQVRSAVSSLDSVKDSDTVHKELLAMTIQEKLSDHTRELNTLMPRVPTDTKPAVEKAMMVSSDGLVVAQSAIKRLMTIRTPQPSDVPPLSTDSSVLPTGSGATPTDVDIFVPYQTATDEYKQIFSSTTAADQSSNNPSQPRPTLAPAGPTSIPLPTSTPDLLPTDIPDEPVVTPTDLPTRIPPTSTPAPTLSGVVTSTPGSGPSSTTPPYNSATPSTNSSAPAPTDTSVPQNLNTVPNTQAVPTATIAQ